MADINSKVIITAVTTQAENSLRTLGQSAEGLSRKMFDLSGAAGTLTGALTVTAFAGFIKSSINAQDELFKLSQRTGTSVEALAGLKFAADQQGTSLEAVALAGKHLSSAMIDHPDLFKKAGVTAKDTTGAMVQLADIFKAMPDGIEKSKLAVLLFGKSGDEMIQFLNTGTAGLHDMIEQGKKYNATTDLNAAAANNFNDQLAQLKAIGEGFGNSWANNALPRLTGITTAMIQAADSGSKLAVIWAGLKGIGTVFLTDQFDGVSAKIYDLTSELHTLERQLDEGSIYAGHSGFIHKWLYGTDEDIAAKIAATKKQIADLTNPTGPTWKKTTPAAGTDTRGTDFLHSLMGNQSQSDFDAFQKRLQVATAPQDDNGKQTRAAKLQVELNLDDTITLKERDKLQLLIDQVYTMDKVALAKKSEIEGQQIIIGLEKDFRNELDKRNEALNSPLLSARDRIIADDMRTIDKRAQESRIELEKLNSSGSLTAADYSKRLQQVTADEEAQKIAVKELDDAQTKLNATWQYGAQIAMRSYLDEAANVAKQSEQMFSRAFQGMEDGVTNFVKTGKLDFSSMADSFITNLIRIQVKQAEAGLLGNLSSMNGGYGPFGNFVGPMPQAANGAWFDGSVSAFANGGAFTNGLFSSPTLFKFAGGGKFGVMGEAGPEAVMPLTRGSDGKLGVRAQGGGGNVVVNVIESPGNGGKTQSRNEGGTNVIDVFVEQVKTSIAGDISRGNGSIPAAMSRTYGLNRSAGAY